MKYRHWVQFILALKRWVVRNKVGKQEMVWILNIHGILPKFFWLYSEYVDTPQILVHKMFQVSKLLVCGRQTWRNKIRCMILSFFIYKTLSYNDDIFTSIRLRNIDTSHKSEVYGAMILYSMKVKEKSKSERPKRKRTTPKLHTARKKQKLS